MKVKVERLTAQSALEMGLIEILHEGYFDMKPESFVIADKEGKVHAVRFADTIELKAFIRAMIDYETNHN